MKECHELTTSCTGGDPGVTKGTERLGRESQTIHPASPILAEYLPGLYTGSRWYAGYQEGTKQTVPAIPVPDGMNRRSPPSLIILS